MQHLTIRFWLLFICLDSFAIGTHAAQPHIINTHIINTKTKSLHSFFPRANNGLIHDSVSSQRTKQQNATAKMHLLAQIA